MATTARIARVLIVAMGILALSVTAAQARPTGLGDAPARTVAARGYDTTLNRTSVGYTGQSAAANVSNGPGRAVGPANAQQVPIVVTQAVPQPVNVADSGFNWTAGMLGAGIAMLVLLLAAITASRIRPQRVAHL